MMPASAVKRWAKGSLANRAGEYSLPDKYLRTVCVNRLPLYSGKIFALCSAIGALVPNVLVFSVHHEDIGMEEGFLDEAAEPENEPLSKAQVVKNTLEKRRLLDDVLIEHRLRRELKDYDFDLDD
jgi:hypothetical protein